MPSWTPVNAPDQDITHNATPIDIPTVPAEPARKRRKKQNNVDLPSPPKTVRAKRAIVPKKASKTTRNTEPTSITEDGTREKNDQTTRETKAILSETTRSKLNSFRFGALPTPASENDPDEENKENDKARISPSKTAISINSEHSSKADSLLSDDLWKNQQPLPQYPWLYTENNYPGLTVSSGDNVETTESRFFTELLKTEAQPQAGLQENFIDDAQLDSLMDALDKNQDISEPKDHHVAKSKQPSLVKTAADNLANTQIDLDEDWTVDDEDYQLLCEAADIGHSPVKTESMTSGQSPSAVNASATYPTARKNKTMADDEVPGLDTTGIAIAESPQERFNNEANRGDSHTDIAYMDEFDDGEDFQEMLDLVDALPQSAIEHPAIPEKRSPGSTGLLEVVPSTVPMVDLTSSPPVMSTRPIHTDRSPFVRPPHPQALEIPGPIPGLSLEKRILTCFRIGEAINATVTAHRQGFKIFIELYARVLDSVRAGPIQTFRLVDVWSSPEKLGIVLDGRWTGWEKVELWKKDGNVF